MKIRKVRNSFVTIVDQKLTRDDRLSWKARGIFFYLWSQADNWDFNATEVSRHATDGRKSLDTGLDELERFGYLKRERKRNKLGQLTTSDWQLSDLPVEAWIKDRAKPIPENRKLDQPISGFPNLDNPNLENGEQSKHQEKITSNVSKGSSSSNYINIYFKQIRQKPTKEQFDRLDFLAKKFKDPLAVRLILQSALDAANPSVRYAEICLQRYIRQGKLTAEAVKKDILDFKASNLTGIADEQLPTIPVFKLMDQ